MLTCLTSLRELGKAVSTLYIGILIESYVREQREMPVFGLLENQVVVGIIVRPLTSYHNTSDIKSQLQDELHRLPLDETENPAPVTGTKSASSTPRKTKKRKEQRDEEPSEGSTQTPLTRFFTISPRKATESNADITRESSSLPAAVSKGASMYRLHLMDTKTRRSLGLPPDEDTVSSRLQLMMYRRLLSSLLENFDFDVFWILAGVDPNALFSSTFSEQIRPLVTDNFWGNGESVGLNLNSLVALWVSTVQDLAIASVSPELMLIYRSQSSSRGKRKRITKTEILSDIQAAVKASLQDAGLESDPVRVKELTATIASPPSRGSSDDDTETPGPSNPAPSANVGEGIELAWTVEPRPIKDAKLASAGQCGNVTMRPVH
jgi:hypothetical protein